MKKIGKQAIALAVCGLTLAAGAAVGAVVAESSVEESLISLSYLNDTYIPQVAEQAASRVEERLDAVYADALEQLQQLAGQQPQPSPVLYSTAYTRQTVSLADRLVLPTGSGLILERGCVSVTHEGTVVDVTAGQALASGEQLTAGHRYLVAEETQATFSIDSDAAVLAVEGGYTLIRSGVEATPFTDVTIHDWFHDAVQTVYFHGLFSGMDDGTVFIPEERMSRAMMMTVLFHLAQNPMEELPDTLPSFPDVVEGEWYVPFVSWAAEKGISAGYEDGTFRPDSDMTRQEVVQFLCNYAYSYMDIDISSQADLSVFDDAGAVEEWALPAMTWAVGVGLIDSLRPLEPASRAEVASMLSNFAKTFL